MRKYKNIPANEENNFTQCTQQEQRLQSNTPCSNTFCVLCILSVLCRNQ